MIKFKNENSKRRRKLRSIIAESKQSKGWEISYFKRILKIINKI